MKKHCFLCILTTLLFIGCKSREDKAVEVIKTELFKTLDDYSSYEPIETKIDSSFTSIYNDSRISDWGARFGNLLTSMDEYYAQLKEAESYMQIWRGIPTPLGRSEYTKANKKYHNIREEGQGVLKTMGELSDSIKARKKIVPINKFRGWSVHHKFRSKNKEGNFVIFDHIYILDKEMKNIIDEYDVQDIDQMKPRVIIDMALRYDSNDI